MRHGRCHIINPSCHSQGFLIWLAAAPKVIAYSPPLGPQMRACQGEITHWLTTWLTAALGLRLNQSRAFQFRAAEPEDNVEKWAAACSLGLVDEPGRDWQFIHFLPHTERKERKHVSMLLMRFQPCLYFIWSCLYIFTSVKHIDFRCVGIKWNQFRTAAVCYRQQNTTKHQLQTVTKIWMSYMLHFPSRLRN